MVPIMEVGASTGFVWIIDDAGDKILLAFLILILSSGILIAISLILRFLRKKDIKLGQLTVAEDEETAENEVKDEKVEQQEILKRLEQNSTLLTTLLVSQGQDLQVLFSSHQDLLVASKLVIKAIHGPLNGNSEEALTLVNGAQKQITEHLLSKVGKVKENMQS